MADFDFGFTTHSANDVSSLVDTTVVDEQLYDLQNRNDDLIDRLLRLDALVRPLIEKLYQTADQPLINWPNRGPTLQGVLNQMDELIQL